MPLAAAEREAPARIHARIVEAGLAEEYPFASRFLDVDGGRMHYVDEGPRDAAPVLMLHGNPTWSFLYRRLVKALSGEHRCVAPDHIGCGLSDKPQDWRYDLVGHIENVEKLVLALDLRDLTLVVHDWGGPIGLGFARRHPERVARVVITNTAAFPGPAPLRLRVCRAPWIGPFLVQRLNAFAGTAPTLAVQRPLSATARAGFALPYRKAADRIAVARFVQDIPLSPKDRSWAELAEIEASLDGLRTRPLCILWGERDFVFTPAFREEWQKRLPKVEVHRLEEAGHWLYEDEPTQVERLIGAFVSTPRRGP
ncbi:MAG: alpha/beta fold hydrolase [Planctomycetota bacterium]